MDYLVLSAMVVPFIHKKTKKNKKKLNFLE